MADSLRQDKILSQTRHLLLEELHVKKSDSKILQDFAQLLFCQTTSLDIAKWICFEEEAFLFVSRPLFDLITKIRQENNLQEINV